MVHIKPLTKKDLLGALKNLPTKKDVKKILKDEIFVQLSEFHANLIKPDIETLKTETREGFAGVNKRLKDVELEVSYLKDGVQGLKADLSTTVSKKEFGQFKRKMNKTLPAVSL